MRGCCVGLPRPAAFPMLRARRFRLPLALLPAAPPLPLLPPPLPDGDVRPLLLPLPPLPLLLAAPPATGAGSGRMKARGDEAAEEASDDGEEGATGAAMVDEAGIATEDASSMARC